VTGSERGSIRARLPVAYGQDMANIMRPFWALPLLAITGIGMRREIGLSVISFFVSLMVFGGAQLFLV
jgi:short-chain fatty acids transporter